MLGVTGVGAAGGLRRMVLARISGGFTVPEEAAPPELAAATHAMPVSLLLTLQETEGDGRRESRQALADVESGLEALEALQVALLRGEGSEALQQFEKAMQAAPASDQRLAALQKALRLRVLVELARRQAAASV